MSIPRTLLLGLVGLCSAVPAWAQFDGPAPLAWRYFQPTKVAATGSPLVVNGRAYVSVGGRVIGIDAATGNRRFQFPQLDPIEGSFRTAPVFAANTVIAVGDNKIMYGIDPVSGTLKWSYNLPSAVRGAITTVSDKYAVVGLQDNTLVAVDATDGKPLWPSAYKVLEGLDGGLTGTSDGAVLYFNRNLELVSLNVNAMKSTWRRKFNQLPATARPVIYNDIAYVATGPFVALVNVATGGVRGQINTGLQLQYPPAVSASGVAVVGQSVNVTTGAVALLYGLDRQLITKKPVELNSYPVTAPSSVGANFLFPTTNGALNLVDPQGGLLWSYVIRPLPDQVGGSNAGTSPDGNGNNMLGGGGGLGGARPTTTPIVSIVASGPAVLSGETLFVPAADGSLLAFDRKEGVDLTAPKVSMLFPQPGSQVSGQPPLVFVFKIEDDAVGYDLRTLEVSVDGKPMKYEVARDANIVVRISSVGPNKPLMDGRREIKVKVKDWLGNEANQTFGLRIDNTLAPLPLPGSATPNNQGGRPGGPGGAGGGDI